MDIGVLKEISSDEHRVALTPQAARQLVTEGHRVFVEQGAGQDGRFSDPEYRDAGAETVFSREEVLRRGRMILGVRAPSVQDASFLDQGQVLFGFLHLSAGPKELIAALLERKVTAIGYELVLETDGRAPILSAIGELAGQMVVHIAAHLLQNESGGRGILLGEASGANPAMVLVLGAGTVGRTAARFLSTLGAHVVLADCDRERLCSVDQELSGRVETFLADQKTVARFTAVTDVVIGAVRIRGARAPYLITRDMVAAMRPGSVIIDVAIDQGGCVETSRPTTLRNPTFKVNEVVHYCVPNLTANIPRTASKVLSQTHLPYVKEVANSGVDAARQRLKAVQSGIYLHDGAIQLPELVERLK